MNNKLNPGLENYKKMQRNETLTKIDVSISYLREHGLPITKKAVADETGLSYSTLKKEYVKIHLLRYPEFNPEMGAISSDKSADSYKMEIASLKTALDKERKSKKLLTAENIKLKAELVDLREKYQRLLGTYQKDIGKKIIPF